MLLGQRNPISIKGKKWFSAFISIVTATAFITFASTVSFDRRIKVIRHDSNCEEVISSSRIVTRDEHYNRIFNTSTIKSTTMTTTEWMPLRQDVFYVDESKLRCKAKYLGCFILLFPLHNSIEFLDKQDILKYRFEDVCMDYCFTRGQFAAINKKTRSCKCHLTIEGFISDRTRGKWADYSSDISQKCMHPSAHRVYMKTTGCEKGISDNSMENDRMGCVDIPSTLYKSMVAFSLPSGSVAQCILVCEDRNFPYSVPVLARNTCICSDSVSLFRKAEYMKRLTYDCFSKPMNDKAPVYKTLYEDPECTVKFLDQMQGMPVLLASYFGSGNTWMRHLIEVSTGVFTGSVYRDMKLYEGGFLGELTEPNSGRTVAIKDHIFRKKIRPEFKSSAILLIRNPYDATLAEWNRRSTKNHTGVVDTESYRTKEFERFVKNKYIVWSDIIKVVMEHFPNVLVVYYEELRRDAVKQMRRVADFLPSQNIIDHAESFEKRLICMNVDLAGNFKRPPRKLDFDPFTPTERENFNKAMKDIDDILLSRHINPLPESYFVSSFS